MTFTKAIRYFKVPYQKRKIPEIVYFCDICGQGFKKPQKHFLDVKKRIKCSYKPFGGE
jgi:hypothetical protein